MKKISAINLGVIVVSTTLLGVEITVSDNSAHTNITVESNQTISIDDFERVTVKDGGEERFILVPKDEEVNNNSIGTFSAESNSDQAVKKGLIIAFQNDSVVIDQFETLFGLGLKEELVGGFYIFDNNSNMSDIELIQTILQSESSSIIKTLRPNWKMNMSKF